MRAALAFVVLGACRAADAPSASARWSYDVVVSDDAELLTIDASVGGDARALDVDPDTARFVRDLQTTDRVRYRFALGEAARALHDAGNAAEFEGAIVSPLSSWLMHPRGATAASYRVRVRGGAPFVPTEGMNLPSFGFPHAWLDEGIATYVEPIARARAGTLPVERVWRDLLLQASQGLPQGGDEGLEKTHTWGRTYWGGALYCLAADVEIRKRTGNARSFDDVLRAIVATGASAAQRWTTDELLAIAERSTGTKVLSELFARLALAPGKVDLDAMWRDLGVAASKDGVTFDDRAPFAAIRSAITAP